VAKLSPVDLSALDDRQAEVYRHLLETRGWLPNVLRVGLHNPDALSAFTGVGSYFRQASPLDPAVHELVILTVAHETRSVYQWTHHVGDAEGLGLDRDTLRRLLVERDADEQPLLAAVVRLTRAIVAAETPDEATFATLTVEVGEAGIYALAILAVYYLGISRLVVAFEVELDDGADAATLLDGSG